MKKLIFPIFIGLILYFNVFSQEKINLKETFQEAENYILYEDYEEALALYQKLVSNNHINAYINHRIGECYLQIPGKKNKAIPYLKKACEQISSKIKEGNFKEKNAPSRTLFYLGDAYQVNNLLDKAILTYKKFKESLDAQDIYNMAYVNQQVESCNNAKELITNPLNIKKTNIGNVINDEFSNEMPVVSPDEQAIVFISKLKFYNAIYYSEKAGEKWTTPINITPDIKSDGDFYPCYLSADKKTLLLSRIENLTENIYISNFDNGKWQIPGKLNKNINTKFWESHATLSPDGKAIYFVSNRKGGYGGLDIYKSIFDEEKNDWGEAINLGSEINTPLNEESPKLSEDGQILYFSSQCHYNMGGFDIFYSMNVGENKWSTPINIGYPINTTDDDLFFYPIKNGNCAYISAFDKNGYGQKDIIRVEFEDSKNLAQINVCGNLCPKTDVINFTTDNFKVEITELDKKEPVKNLSLNSKQFSIELTPGVYSFTFNSKTYKQIVKTVFVPNNYSRTNLLFNIYLDPIENRSNKFITIK